MNIFQLDVKFKGFEFPYFTPHSFYSTLENAETAQALLGIQLKTLKQSRIVEIELDSYLNGALAHYEKQLVVSKEDRKPDIPTVIENGVKIFKLSTN